MKFTPHTKEEIAEMLSTVGVSEIDALFAPIPAELKTKGGLDLPEGGISEPEAVSRLKRLAGRNKSDMTCFLGGAEYMIISSLPLWTHSLPDRSFIPHIPPLPA